MNFRPVGKASSNLIKVLKACAPRRGWRRPTNEYITGQQTRYDIVKSSEIQIPLGCVDHSTVITFAPKMRLNTSNITVDLNSVSLKARPASIPLSLLPYLSCENCSSLSLIVLV